MESTQGNERRTWKQTKTNGGDNEKLRATRRCQMTEFVLMYAATVWE